jgi:cell division GTPase FtsZ
VLNKGIAIMIDINKLVKLYLEEKEVQEKYTFANHAFRNPVKKLINKVKHVKDNKSRT